jgi:hypothetical protein
MAKRLSNRQRIERMAEEASIKAEDTEPKTEVRKAPRSRKAAPKAKRMKFIWTVVDEKSKEIASFPYPAKDEAEAKAAALAEKTGKAHKVIQVRVPMEDNE